MTNDETPDIIWEDPPPNGHHDQSVQATLAACKANPGQWAKLVRGDGAGFFSGSITQYKHRGFEAVSRNYDPDTKRSDVYVRWPVEDPS